MGLFDGIGDVFGSVKDSGAGLGEFFFDFIKKGKN